MNRQRKVEGLLGSPEHPSEMSPPPSAQRALPVDQCVVGWPTPDEGLDGVSVTSAPPHLLST